MELKTLNIQKALVLVLQDVYFSEWKSLDGFEQHPLGYSFYEWLYKNDLIDESEFLKAKEEASQIED